MFAGPIAEMPLSIAKEDLLLFVFCLRHLLQMEPQLRPGKGEEYDGNEGRGGYWQINSAHWPQFIQESGLNLANQFKELCSFLLGDRDFFVVFHDNVAAIAFDILFDVLKIDEIGSVRPVKIMEVFQ